MQAIILAAGDGSRMRPLTLTKPKVLLEVAGKTLLEHLVHDLPDQIDELVIVIGYLGEQIQQYCGGAFMGKKVTYVWQKEKTGTGRAVQLCKNVLRPGSFMVLAAADDIIGRKALAQALAYERCIITAVNDHPEKFGVLTLHDDGRVKDFVEKPKEFISNLVNTNSMVLDHHVFEYEPDQHTNGEFYLTTMVSKLAKDYPVYTVSADLWIPIATPEDLQKAETMLK